MTRVRARLLVRGMVQGVGFRWFTQGHATRMGLDGYVRNLGSGDVEAEVEGDRSVVEEFIRQIRVGPRHGHVADVRVEWLDPDRGFRGFTIRY